MAGPVRHFPPNAYLAARPRPPDFPRMNHGSQQPGPNPACQSARPGDNALYEGSLDSSQVKRIHEMHSNAMYARPGYLVFMRGSSLMAQRLDARNAELSGDLMVLAHSVARKTSTVYGQFSISENGALTYLAGANVATQLVWFDRSGKRLGTVGEPPGYTNPAISPDQNVKCEPQAALVCEWMWRCALLGHDLRPAIIAYKLF